MQDLIDNLFKTLPGLLEREEKSSDAYKVAQESLIKLLERKQNDERAVDATYLSLIHLLPAESKMKFKYEYDDCDCGYLYNGPYHEYEYKGYSSSSNLSKDASLLQLLKSMPLDELADVFPRHES